MDEKTLTLLQDFAERTQEVARQIQQGSRPADLFQNAVAFEMPKSIDDPQLRELERQPLWIAKMVDIYLQRHRSN